jgi:hypothetical protein
MSENPDYTTVLSRVKVLRLITQKCTSVFSRVKVKVIQVLLDNIKGSPFELVRSASCNLLIDMDWTFDELDPSYNADSLIRLAQDLINQSLTVPRLRGSMMYRLLMHKLSMNALSKMVVSSKSDLVSTKWIDLFLSQATFQIDLIANEFECILNGHPLHGSMECLLHAITLAGDSLPDPALVDSISSVSNRTFALTNNYFECKLSLASGTDPLGETTVDESGLDATTCPVERMTSAIWRSCKCASQILLALISIVPENSKAEIILSSGKYMLDLLVRTRHWGLTQHIQLSFDALLAKPKDSSLLNEWIQV